MKHRIKLLKSWKHPYKSKPYGVGTVLQVDNELKAELIKSKQAVEYSGEYPPKSKDKINLKQLK
jgi:hypothetical protein